MSTTNELLSALHGKRGDLNAWLVTRDEKEVRTAILAIVSPQETLRDKFAAKAMQEHMRALSAADLGSPEEWNATVSEFAYLTADAMLKAREEKP